MKKILWILFLALLAVNVSFASELTTITALVADGTSEIDTTLENARGGVNTVSTNLGTTSDSSKFASGASLYGLTRQVLLNNMNLVQTSAAVTIIASGNVIDTLFTVTGNNIVHCIWGQVGTAFKVGAGPNQTAKLSNLSAAVTTDLCTDAVAGDSLRSCLSGSLLTITGTFANGLVETAPNVPLTAPQAAKVLVRDGYIIVTWATIAGSYAGSVRWGIVYEPLEDGAVIIQTPAGGT